MESSSTLYNPSSEESLQTTPDSTTQARTATARSQSPSHRPSQNQNQPRDNITQVPDETPSEGSAYDDTAYDADTEEDAPDSGRFREIHQVDHPFYLYQHQVCDANGNVYDRYVADDTTDGRVYDRYQRCEIPRLIPRIIPQSNHFCWSAPSLVVDLLAGPCVRRRTMMDDLRERNRNRELIITDIERELGVRYYLA